MMQKRINQDMVSIWSQVKVGWVYLTWSFKTASELGMEMPLIVLVGRRNHATKCWQFWEAEARTSLEAPPPSVRKGLTIVLQSRFFKNVPSMNGILRTLLVPFPSQKKNCFFFQIFQRNHQDFQAFKNFLDFQPKNSVLISQILISFPVWKVESDLVQISPILMDFLVWMQGKDSAQISPPWVVNFLISRHERIFHIDINSAHFHLWLVVHCVILHPLWSVVSKKK